MTELPPTAAQPDAFEAIIRGFKKSLKARDEALRRLHQWLDGRPLPMGDEPLPSALKRALASRRNAASSSSTTRRRRPPPVTRIIQRVKIVRDASFGCAPSLASLPSLVPRPALSEWTKMKSWLPL
jgi:hypothetical protein